MPLPVSRVGIAVLALIAAGCSSAAAAAALHTPPAATTDAATPVVVAESVAIVQRLEAESANALPDLVGQRADQAASALLRAGAEATIIKMDPKATRVSAQWPEAGSPVTAEPVVVWIGKPPTTPATPSPVETDAGKSSTASPSPTAGAPETIVETPPPSPLSTTVTSPVSGKTPGLDGFVAPPHPPRANIRTLTPAAPGTAMAGRASWYGPGFDGHQTACGGIFDSSQLTIASRELRCGTQVDVTGPNGTVRATVTDWGPAEWTARRFDLSRATFDAVASLGTGVIDVTVTVTD